MVRARLLLLAVGLVACQSPGPPSVPAHVLRERHRAVEIGQTRAQVRDQMGDVPVRRPGHPDAPFPTPYREVELRPPGGGSLRLEVYVVATRPAEGCPDVQYDDRPVAYRDGRVVATTWEELEWGWRDWGGDLASLRAAQDRFVCDPDLEAGGGDPAGADLDTGPAPSYIPAPSEGD
ncbi:MAG: hypothetical protein ACQGVC_05065 [Myxococcota bacterium]